MTEKTDRTGPTPLFAKFRNLIGRESYKPVPERLAVPGEMFVEPKKNTMTMPRYYEGYQENDSNNAGTALLTFVLGAAAGVAAGLLLAPSSGQESRRKIATAANDLASKAGDQWGTVKEKATTTINKVAGKDIAGGSTANPSDQLNNF